MYYEELQIAYTYFKTHEQLQIFKKTDSQLLYEQHLLLRAENITKYTGRHSTRT